jgi:hypothetical protein
MKLCDICLKTFRDNYALKRHQTSKACTDISSDTQKTILLNKDYTYNNENNNSNTNTSNTSSNNKIIKIDNKYTINNKDNEEYKSYKKVMIFSNKIKSDEMVSIKKPNKETHTTIIENISNNEIYDFKLEPKIVKKGEIFNCSLCQTEFKYRNNFYRHKKKCPIILKSL